MAAIREGAVVASILEKPYKISERFEQIGGALMMQESANHILTELFKV